MTKAVLMSIQAVSPVSMLATCTPLVRDPRHSVGREDEGTYRLRYNPEAGAVIQLE